MEPRAEIRSSALVLYTLAKSGNSLPSDNLSRANIFNDKVLLTIYADLCAFFKLDYRFITLALLQKSYRKLVLIIHPDKTPMTPSSSYLANFPECRDEKFDNATRTSLINLRSIALHEVNLKKTELEKYLFITEKYSQNLSKLNLCTQAGDTRRNYLLRSYVDFPEWQATSTLSSTLKDKINREEKERLNALGLIKSKERTENEEKWKMACHIREVESAKRQNDLEQLMKFYQGQINQVEINSQARKGKESQLR